MGKPPSKGWRAEAYMHECWMGEAKLVWGKRRVE